MTYLSGIHPHGSAVNCGDHGYEAEKSASSTVQDVGRRLLLKDFYVGTVRVARHRKVYGEVSQRRNRKAALKGERGDVIGAGARAANVIRLDQHDVTETRDGSRFA